MELREFLADVLTLFAIVNPIGNFPVFMDLMANWSAKKKAATLNLAPLIGLIILLAFTLLGQELLDAIHISFNDIKIAGGVILLVLSIRSLVFRLYSRAEVERQTTPEISAVPLAFPLLVGPGAIVTALLLQQKDGLGMAAFIVFLVFFMVWLALRFMVPLFRVLGDFGAKLISKIMYLILAAIAVKFIMTGILNYGK